MPTSSGSMPKWTNQQRDAAAFIGGCFIIGSALGLTVGLIRELRLRNG